MNTDATVVIQTIVSVVPCAIASANSAIWSTIAAGSAFTYAIGIEVTSGSLSLSAAVVAAGVERVVVPSVVVPTLAGPLKFDNGVGVRIGAERSGGRKALDKVLFFTVFPAPTNGTEARRLEAFGCGING